MTALRSFELATSTLHNAWQFYKNDNYFYNRKAVAHHAEALVTSLLKSHKVKNWFRAYLNLGLIEKILGHPRLIPCTAGTDFAFIDPWSDVWACNVRSDLRMGNLTRQSWDEIMQSDAARIARGKVAQCSQNCWMVTTARTAMRSTLLPQLPKLKPLAWVLANKARVLLGKRVPFDRYIDYSNVMPSPQVQRLSFLDQRPKVKLERERDSPEKRYPLKDFQNT